MIYWLRLPLAALLLTLFAGPARPCSTPVFRYALERWRPDLFEVLVAHRGPLTAEQQALVKSLGGGDDSAAQANIEIRTLDLAEDLDPEDRGLVKGLDPAALPLLLVRPPGHKEVVWKGPLTKANAAALVDSPARRELARRLLKGDSAVCLVLLSGDAAKDATHQKRLTDLAKKLQETVKLSEPDPEDVATLRRGAEAALPPLQVRFSVLAVSPVDPAETFLRAVVLAKAAEDKVAAPLACWVFGRGRFLPLVPLDHRDADEDLADMAAYLCGPCSCQVKRLNPGADLLLAVSWEELIEGRYVVDQDLPALPSVSGPGVPPAPLPPTEPASRLHHETSTVPPILWYTLAGVVVGTLAGTAVVLLRKEGGRP
jgi:hypothetical protein